MRRKPGERWNCKACGVELVGAQSSANPKTVMPVRMEPVDNGNVLLQQVAGTLTGFVVGNNIVRGALKDLGVVMRINHFSDCVHADRFRTPTQTEDS